MLYVKSKTFMAYTFICQLDNSKNAIIMLLSSKCGAIHQREIIGI